MLDNSTTLARRSSPRRRAAGKPAERAPSFKGPHASVGPYVDEAGNYEVRLERVPGGLRLASWSAGAIRRSAPVLLLEDLPELLQRALDGGVLDDELRLPRGVGNGTSPGRAGELRDELRVEALEGGRLRVARWLLRPGRGWELQEAPVMLPPARYAEAFQRAAG